MPLIGFVKMGIVDTKVHLVHVLNVGNQLREIFFGNLGKIVVHGRGHLIKIYDFSIVAIVLFVPQREKLQ